MNNNSYDMNEYIQKVKELALSMPNRPKAHVKSYGCQLNFCDGDKLKRLASDMGFELCDNEFDADLIVFNTCAVRENAEDRAFGNIGFAKHIKEKNPKTVIALCGCMAQQAHIAEKIKKSYPFVDIVFGTSAQSHFPELLYKKLVFGRNLCDITEYNDGINEELSPLREGLYKASVPIMYGCNNFCTYCVVPYVRGRERSRNYESILSEVRQLVNSGYKEIMLLGQNVNSYNGDISFPELLYRINDIDGDFVVRFMSSHPKDAKRELIDAVIGCEKIANQIHLPVQSGSNAVLERMNRRYTVGKYLEIIDYARSISPNFSFSSDILVGFPDESSDDFKATLDLIERVKYDNLYTFIYSKRERTVAATMPDSITEKEKSERMGQLLALQRQITTESYKRFMGKTLRVLAESESKSGENWLLGKSYEGIIVEFPADKSLLGKFVNVKINNTKNWAVEGVVVD